MNQLKPCGLAMGCGTSGTAAGAIRSMGCGAFSGGTGGAGGLVGGVRAAGGAAAWPGGTTSVVGCSGGAGAAVKAVTVVAVDKKRTVMNTLKKVASRVESFA